MSKVIPFILGLLLGCAVCWLIMSALQKDCAGCEVDLGICKMGRETRQSKLDDTEQSLNQCQQQLKRMR